MSSDDDDKKIRQTLADGDIKEKSTGGAAGFSG